MTPRRSAPHRARAAPPRSTPPGGGDFPGAAGGGREERGGRAGRAGTRCRRAGDMDRGEQGEGADATGTAPPGWARGPARRWGPSRGPARRAAWRRSRCRAFGACAASCIPRSGSGVLVGPCCRERRWRPERADGARVCVRERRSRKKKREKVLGGGGGLAPGLPSRGCRSRCALVENRIQGVLFSSLL